MHINAEDVGCQSFLLTNFIQQFLISSSLGNENTDYFLSFIIWTTSNNTTLVNHDLIYYYPNSNPNYSPNFTQAEKIYNIMFTN